MKNIAQEVAVSSIVTTAILIVLLVVTVGYMLASSAQRDLQLSNISDCVVETAISEGYKGNPYGQEAWTIFENNCR